MHDVNMCINSSEIKPGFDDNPNHAVSKLNVLALRGSIAAVMSLVS